MLLPECHDEAIFDQVALLVKVKYSYNQSNLNACYTDEYVYIAYIFAWAGDFIICISTFSSTLLFMLTRTNQPN